MGYSLPSRLPRALLMAASLVCLAQGAVAADGEPPKGAAVTVLTAAP
jgi:hypothetical protein